MTRASATSRRLWLMSIQKIEREPLVSVGLMTGAKSVAFELEGDFVNSDGGRLEGGSYHATPIGAGIEIVSDHGWRGFSTSECSFAPVELSSSFIVRDVTIGVDFHWQRKQDQQFQGALKIRLDADGLLTVINEISVEGYLTSVISSEMSANSH